MSQRIVIVNPNSTEAVTAGISAAVAPLRKAEGPALDCLTLEEGPPGIETLAHIRQVVPPLLARLEREAADASVIDCLTLEEGPPGIESLAHIHQVVPPLLARLEREAADASVIACFSDPGLAAARTASARPVFGIGESSFRAALRQGKRFGIVAILEASTIRHRRYVAELGLAESFAASRPLNLGVLELQDHDKTLARMLEVGRALRDEDQADVLVLGCAGMTGFSAELSEALGLPVIEPCQAAAAEAVTALEAPAGPQA